MTRIPPPLLSPPWSSRTKRAVVLVCAAVGLLGLLWFSPILPPIIVSMLLAYLLSPVATFFEQRVLIFPPLRGRPQRGLAVLLTFLLVVALFVVIVLVIVPGLILQLEEFGRSLPRLLSSLESELERILSEPITFNNEPILVNGSPLIPLEQLAEITGTNDMGDFFQTENIDLVGAAQTFLGSLGGVTGPAFSFLGGAITTLINLGFLIAMTVYLLKDGARFAQKMVEFTPQMYRSDARRLMFELTRVWNAYLRGQILLGLIVGTAVYFAALLLGLPNPPILGLVAGLLEFIPSIGPFISQMLAAFLALLATESSTIPFLQGFPFMLTVLVVWGLIQNFEALVLIPRIMGNSLDLHPFVVILGVLGGATVAGPLGIILAAPFIASGRVLILYIYGKLTDRDPFREHIQRPKVSVIPRWAAALWSRALPLLPDWARRKAG